MDKGMNEIDLGSLDLNLLKVFDRVMQERSVTLAAETLGLGQPAVSHALGRLRAITGDRLFVRGTGGMQPTPRAAAMAPAIRQALFTVEQALHLETSFDPATAQREFRIATSDYVEATLMAPVLGLLSETAPGVRLAVLPLHEERVERDLADGSLDLAIGVFPRVSSALRKAPILSDRHVCVFNAASTGLSDPVDIDGYCGADHVMMSQRGDRGDDIDEILAERHRRRTVRLVSANFLTLGYYLRTAPVIATLPGILARRYADQEGLSVSPLPFEAPEFMISTLWHGRQHEYPPLVWLRRLFTGALVSRNKETRD